MKSLSILLPLALLTAAPAALAQYPSDPAVNLAIGDSVAEQTQPKVVPGPGGGAYVSWFDSDAAGTPAFGYDVRLQRLDAAGHELWPHGGILIADRGFSSTQDYGLDVDASGNALLVFRDDRFGGVQITASLVDPSGTQLWGPTGVQLTSTTAFLAAPKIAGASDGGIFVAWSQDNSIGLQRLSAAGVPTWASNLVLTAPTGSYAMSDMHAADSGSAVFSFVFSAGGFGSPRHLYANKISAVGAPLWGPAHVKVFDGGSLQFGNFPSFVSDSAGGAVFGWYSSSPSLEAYAQRVSAAGIELFPHNGVSASTDATKVRVAPAVAYDAAEQEVFLLYEELNSSQSQSGLSAQKFDVTGQRAWGPTGLSLLAVGVTKAGTPAVVALDDGAQLIWSESAGFGQDQLFAQVLDDAGAVVHAVTSLSSVPAQKYRVTATKSSLGHAHVVWQDDRAGNADVYAQDYLPNGTLGGAASSQVRNGAGGNPVVLASATAPAIGGLWLSTVDKSAQPGNLGSILFVYGQPSAGLFLTEGEVLVDLFSLQFLAQFANTSVASDAYSVPIPAAIGLVGIQVSSQALILDLAGSQLTNAVDLTLGL